MAGKFGADFNANQPSDADLVKRGASWIRDTKARAKSIMAVCFDLETGQTLDNVIRSASLKTLNPSPEGSWTRVTVNNKGQVTAGEEEEVVIAATPYRWAYIFAHGVQPDGTLVTRALDTDGDGLNVASYSFTVPEGISRINVKVYGAGGGGGFNATPLTAMGGGGGGYTETHIEVLEGDVFLVWVGEGGIGMTAAADPAEKGALTKFEKAALEYAKVTGGTAGEAADQGFGGQGETTSSVSGWGPNLDLRGGPGTPYSGGMGAQSGGGGDGAGIGSGGAPASTGAGGNPGDGGCIIVEYWKS